MDPVSLSNGSSPNGRYERSASASSATEVHRCQWLECTIVFTDANDLYEHITSTHIGRKSAGTLSLECKWTGCTAKASKRDHLTSHVRVHINLKPHTCDICSKSFKRPQDLKKHEKIHTEEHHRDHKQSKAVTVGSKAKKSTPIPVEPIPLEPSPNLSAQVPYSSWSPPSNYHFQLPPPPIYAGIPYGSNSTQYDIAHLVAQQQQLNFQAQAAANNQYPNLAAYNYRSPAYSPTGNGSSSASSSLNQFTNLPPPYIPQHHSMGFSGPPNPFSLPTPHQQSFLPSTPTYTLPLPTPLPPSLPTATSLYPSLPPNFAFYPVVQAPPDFTPTQSYDSSDRSLPRSVHSASVSPKVVALSPLSAIDTPSPEQSERRLSSGSNSGSNSGRKRGFEEAAGEFLGDLRKKNFRESDLDAGLDSLSNFLISPNDIIPPLSHSDSSRSAESSPSGVLDYSSAEVDTMNELLLSLGQSINSPSLNVHSSNFRASISVAYEQQESLPRIRSSDQPLSFNQASTNNPYGSMYPSLGEYGPLSNYRRLNYDASNGNVLLGAGSSTNFPAGNGLGGMSAIQSNKSTAPPAILENETRLPTYRHVERLMKAAPVISSMKSSSMELDEDISSTSGNSNSGGSKYTSSLRSTSLDSVDSASSLPSSSTTTITTTPRASFVELNPINNLVPTSIPTTLPSIRALINLPRLDLNSPTTTTTTTSLYPTIVTSPINSMARLVYGVNSIGMNSTTSTSQINDTMDLDDPEDSSDSFTITSDGKSSKRSRASSAGLVGDMEEDSELESLEEEKSRESSTATHNISKQQIARRLFTLKALVIFLNDSYRKSIKQQTRAVIPTSSLMAEMKNTRLQEVKMEVV